ncbi:ribosome recycling factor [Nosocomiicoccus ampullae]|uniref:Ribosome-recycling factor n=1 Tax=Nosocomiicoccus ampullae TaxID=489910 RepID=A0A9Q2CZR0_9STAP|nr:ribosome recycling factor [Nosocomiicoccus ampullae]MBB5176253.1 ribosome recycling factor [Nosocomiicoccus ampullae]QYA47414.1 ribosome recycling factor [Nosocomiicoccus ampullae]QYA49047.1 ribosome recycling factor [Nosocomiicoccus ampullae]
MANDVIKQAESKMKDVIDALNRNLAGIRTATANASLLDRVYVNYYGADTPLQQLANIQVPEARMLTVTPYDKSSVDDVLKAIQVADLGVNPTSDGTMIRITIPQLTEERRKELTRDVKSEGENSKVAIRNVRRDANDALKKQEKDSEISEDELRTLEDDVQELTNKYVGEIDELVKAKEADIMEV